MSVIWIAYWIAFGPHGPRAEPPKGEGWRVFFKTMQLFAASLAIFYAIHLFARPLPRTMTKEWQEATNEYAKVRIALLSLPRLFPVDALLTDHDPNSGRRSNPSPVSAARDTAARVTSRAPPAQRS